MKPEPGAPAELQLSARDGLPDHIAYLRSAFPRPQWRAHANYGDLADFWLGMHDSLRGQGLQLKEVADASAHGPWPDGADFASVFAPRFNQFIGHLDGHHRVEDHHYFPRFRALDPRMAAGFAILEADHVLIHERILASVEAARAWLRAAAQGADARRQAAEAYGRAGDLLLELLARHLADEEDLVIPAMLRHGERSLG